MKHQVRKGAATTNDRIAIRSPLKADHTRTHSTPGPRSARSATLSTQDHSHQPFEEYAALHPSHTWPGAVTQIQRTSTSQPRAQTYPHQFSTGRPQALPLHSHFINKRL